MMMLQRFPKALIAGLVFASSASIQPAGAYDNRVRAEDREFGYTASLPECTDSAVVGLVTKRFNDREQDYRNSSLTIAEVRDVRTVGFRPNGLDLIPRRYCTATVVTSDLVKRKLDYFVVEDGSIIGWTWGVEWCVSGLDFSYAYGGRCHTARPS